MMKKFRPQIDQQKTVKAGGRPPKKLSRNETTFLKDVAARMKAARVAKGMTGYELAAAVGIGGPTQFNRESGRTSFPIEEIARYAKILNVPPRDLLPE